MKIQTLLASLLVSGAAMAQTPTMKPIVMKTPNEFYILAASGKEDQFFTSKDRRYS